MGWGDYILVCVRQSLLGVGSPDLPNDFIELTDGLPEGRWSREAFDAASELASELFGVRPCEDGTQLFEVQELTLKEAAIAARIDLSHGEKVELIRPLREKRRAAVEARIERPSKTDREYRNGRERRIAAAVAETMVVSDGDRSWARSIGLALD